MFKDIIKDVYDKLIKTTPRKSIYEAAHWVLNKNISKLGVGFPANCPYKKYFEIKENFTLDNLTEDRELAKQIYNVFKQTILKNMCEEERDLYHLCNVYGDLVNWKYDVDILRQTSIQNILINNELIINTKLGKLVFEFATREKYNIKKDTLLIFDDNTNNIIIFVNNPTFITTEEIVDILRHSGRFIHELTHYIDKVKDHWDAIKYDIQNDIAYLNNKNELKANLQMILYNFARYIFKNVEYVKQYYDLRKKQDISDLFETFLCDINRNVVDDEDLEMYRKEISYLTNENKKLFYEELYKYILNDFDINKPVEESYTVDYLLKMLRLEENFWK